MAKANNIEVVHRVRQVMEWLLDGHLSSDIINYGVSKWGIEDRMVYKYLRKALKEFKGIQSTEMKQRLAFHISARMRLYRSLIEKRKEEKGLLDVKDRPAIAGTALDILKDVAKLEGLYVDKIDVKSNGKELKAQTTHRVIKATLKLT